MKSIWIHCLRTRLYSNDVDTNKKHMELINLGTGFGSHLVIAPYNYYYFVRFKS